MDTTFSEIVKKVMGYYPMKVKNIYLISFKGKKAVWSVDTDIGEVIMKKVPFELVGLEFMTFAIDYLRNNGIHTPGVYKTTNGESWVDLEGEYFVIFESVHGRSPEYEHKEELRMIMHGMASFHKASSGINSPTDEYPSFLLTEWEKDMTKRSDRLEAWKVEIAQKADKNTFDQIFLQHIDEFLVQCKSSLAMFEQSGFTNWVEHTKITKTLCHQDYAAGNLAIGSDNHLYVFDMDSLTVDVPIRDMRKILNKVMKKRESGWDLELMLTMMKAYQEVNPLTKEQYHALVADLLYPHLIYGQVNKYYGHREEQWTEKKHIERLKDMIATEKSKGIVLQAFLSRLDEVVAHG
ncbi:CotS family spore coat protein [Paenibacillus crassostreae]|uniref:Aminoglycoside phosphotransferase domain-containing protein n=1 Tax=Paenibacillus crassostreae TaxID=1763538 RepID=A0A167FGD9_9BACL|nr:CotS family spore coat protein [Paenibacillus crassostreae]AOZ94429.1 hypothetical protein LPB68_20965 [Paenibacillus crassostreae]OAB76534.1 hypothetical protein PNBC_03775 [Paenibacillus crassostreae]